MQCDNDGKQKGADMKAWEIIGYAYNADIHCTRCAHKDKMDINGAMDGEGNNPHPIFSVDELICDICADCGENLV